MTTNFILKSAVSVGKQQNHTTVCRRTSQPGFSIEMSFLAERPPIPSTLFVHCPNLCHSYEKPLVLSMVDDFFLVRVVMALPGRPVTCEDLKYDYFIYNPTLSILDELPHPHPRVFYPNQVGLLPRGDKYTVAALVPKSSPFMYDLYLFNSEADSWKSKSLRVSTYLRNFPDEIPNSSPNLLIHKTASVITVGGESGTMGWVDLWHEILVCDVLDPYPLLRAVPLPLPLKQMNSSEAGGIIPGFSGTCRGIAYIEAESCLRFVEIQFDKKNDWSVKTSINRKMTNSWDDWDEDFQAEAKDIKIGSEFSQLISELHSHQDGAVAEPTLQDLFVFQPGLGIDDKQAVYLLTSGQFGGDAWVLALDLKNKTLVDVAKFGTTKQLFSPVIYCFGTFSTSQVASRIGNTFARQYYKFLNSSPEHVHKFYHDESTLSRADSDGTLTCVTTTNDINDYFLSTDLKYCSIQLENVDTQPSLGGGVLIVVTGFFMMPHMKRFAQSFLLAPKENGGHFVLNDVLRYLPVMPSAETNEDLADYSNGNTQIAPFQAKPETSAKESMDPELPSAETNEVMEPSVESISVKDRVTNSFGNENSQVKNGGRKIAEAAPAPPASVHKDVIKQSYLSIVNTKNASTQPAPITKPKTSSSPIVKRGENVEKSSSVPAKTAHAADTAPLNDKNVSHDRGYSIIVKNLPFNATVEMVEAEFRKFGTIKPRGIQVVHRQFNGYCFGFVEFESQQSMYEAIQAAKICFGTHVSYVQEKRTPKQGFLRN